MKVRSSFLAVLSLPALAAASSAGSGFLSGRVKDDRGQPLPGAVVQLVNSLSGHRQVVRSDKTGHYNLFNIPFTEYHLEVLAGGFHTLHRNVAVRSAIPMELNLALEPAGAVVVVEETLSLTENTVSAHLDIDKTTIEQTPAAVQSRAMESILLTTPGFIQDENGRFHFRGSHGQVMYVIDGVPVTDQTQATFSNALDPAQVESMEVVTGGISAEFGGKPGAVVNLSSKSGLGTPGGFEGDFSGGVSRFNTSEVSFGVRGGGERSGYFVSGAASESDRFLDPVNFENFHNHGSTGRLSGRFDWVLTDSDTLRFSLGGGQTHRDVANLASQEAAGQNQRVENLDANLSLGWTHLFSATRTLDVSLFYRHSEAKLLPTQALEPGFTGTGPDFPYWAQQDRTLDNQGVVLAYNQKDGNNTLKTGLQYVRYPIHEQFQFAIPDQAQVEGPSDPLYPYTPAGGGRIFHFDERIAPSLASIFLQDDLKAGNWGFGLGLRLDSYHGRDYVKNELQPRLGVSYAVPSTGTVFRVVYDRLMITPENENLAFSTSQAAWDLTNASGTAVPRLNPELQDSYLVGVEQQLGKSFRVNLDYWQKDSTNAADNDQFLNTGLLFPIAAAKGRFHGMDLRLDTVVLRGWSGYLSAGTVRTLFYSPTLGGLSSADPLVNGPAGTPYLIDHDQKLTLQVGVRYEHEGCFGQVVYRYDSGLMSGDPTTRAAKGADYAFGIPYVVSQQDTLVGQIYRIKPRNVWNLNAGKDFKLGKKKSLQAGVDLLNVFDEKGLYNFMSNFGGTHVIPPRTLAAHVKFKF